MKNIFAVLLLSLLCSCASNQELTPVDTNSPETRSVSAVIPVYSQKILLTLPNANWKISFQNETKDSYRIEFSENPDTKNNDWQELVSLQGFKNMKHIPAEKLLGAFASNYQKSCPNDFKYKAMGPITISNHSGVKAIMGCSQNPKTSLDNGTSRKGELGYYYALHGEKDLYLIHKAYRGQSTEINRLLNDEFAEQFIADILPIKICKNAGHEAECIE